MKIRPIFAVSLGLMLFTGCLTKDMRAPQSSFTVSDFSVPADTAAGSVIYRIPVTSTESWSVLPDPSRTWVGVYMGEFLNTTGVEQTGYIEVLCEDNDSYSPRTATFDVVSPSSKKSFVLTQRAKVNRLSIDGPLYYEIGAKDVKDIFISVKSNTDWVVDFADTSTLSAKFTPAVGSCDGTVKITPVANYAADTVKCGWFSFLANDVDPVVLTVVQLANAPEISVAPVDQTVTCLPEDTAGAVRFSSNSAWKVDIVDSTIDGLTFDATEGGYGKNQTLSFRMSANTGNVQKTAHVNVSLKDSPDQVISFTINQMAGFTIRVNLLNMPTAADVPLKPHGPDDEPISTSSAKPTINYDKKPYVYDYEDPATGEKYLFEIKSKGYRVNLSATAGYFYSEQGWIKYPAVPGYRLAMVGFTTRATDKQFSITADEEGAVVVGEKKQIGKDIYSTWVLSGTQNNTSYYEQIHSSSSRQSDIVLVYAK